MNLVFIIKLIIKKKLGKYLSKYHGSKEVLDDLVKTTPLFMKDNVNRKYNKNLLFMGTSSEFIKVEALFFKALEKLGYKVIILTYFSPYAKKMYQMYGVKDIYFIEDFYQNESLSKFKDEAASIVEGFSNSGELIKFKKDDIHIGEYAASSLMRITRESSINLDDTKMRNRAIELIQYSLRAANAAKNILDKVKPDLLYVNDRVYTPVGQIFDESIKRNIQCFSLNGDYDPHLFILRKYDNTKKNLGLHPCSFIKEDWNNIKQSTWDENKWKTFYSELKDSYFSGDWFSCVGTQFDKEVLTSDKLYSELNIDKDKQTAIIFSHMFWDASFSFGTDLFDNYYDWFVNVIHVAQNKPDINWIIKIHPANSCKASRDGYKGEHKELIAIREVLGDTIPEHIKILEPESNINTFSLFDIMDYCLTVRGTIGIESSAMGIKTLTAGTGRYDNKGFTYDFNTKEEYLEAIENIEQTPDMTDEMIKLAQIHAYYIFKHRALRVDKVNIDYEKDSKASLKVAYKFKSINEFLDTDFAKEFTKYMMSDEQDYIKGKF
jgi:hypothetical protein